jgi:hypothetical protein
MSKAIEIAANAEQNKLIARAIKAQGVADRALAEVKEIEQQLSQEFPGNELTERIVSKWGTVERKVSRTFVVDEEGGVKIVKALGAIWSKYVKREEIPAKQRYVLTAIGKTALFDADLVANVRGLETLRKHTELRERISISIAPIQD